MMAAAAGTIGALQRRAASRAHTAYNVEIAVSWSDVAPAWEAVIAAGGATPFQQPAWLKATYDALPRYCDASPLLIALRDARTGEAALHLPLVMRRENGMRVIAFADLVSDFNAPILGPAAPRTREGIKAAWNALRAALPDADLIRFSRMPPEIAGKPNPLAHRPSAHASATNGNLLVMGDDYDAYRYGLPRTVRKELERSWRVFTRHPEAAFRVVTAPDDITRVMAAMEAQQSERMNGLGVEYLLDHPAVADLYRTVAREGIADGSAVLTALTAGEEIVGALLGLRNRDTYVMVRIAHAGGEWANSSPGRLIIERTLCHLHARGLRRFDFSIGNYAYKRRFAPERTRLVDVVVPLSLRGVPPTVRALAAERVRRWPHFRAFIRRTMGKPPIREEV
jgi:CelD/BcsL family acetyltransferase involved in cellulose biosynthesis